MKFRMPRKLSITVAALIIITAVFVYAEQKRSTPILMYHSLGSGKIKVSSIAPETFYNQMKFLSLHRYKVLPLEEYCRLLKERKRIPPKAIVITFDDGYRDNLEAVKILQEFDYPAVIFMVFDNIGAEGYLSKADIEYFLNNSRVALGSHTLSHSYLPELGVSKIADEIAGSKEKLEKSFFKEITVISYPIGGFDERVLNEVKSAGYLCACTTNRGFTHRTDRFALRRIKVTDRDVGFNFLVKLSGFYNIFRKPKNPY